jgi:predicted permease
VAAILSDALWRSAFGADETIVGRTVVLRGAPHAVVGVAPPGFRLTGFAEIWTPIRPSTTGEGGGENYGVVARLRPGAVWAEAEAQTQAAGVAALANRQTPEVSIQLGLSPLQRGLTADLRRPLLLVWAAVAVVLLIACVNIAGLTLARLAARGAEIAARLALGADRSSIVRLLLAESAALAAAGGVLGLLLAAAAIRLLPAVAPLELSDLARMPQLDGRTAAAAAGFALAAGLVFGLAPALHMSRLDASAALRDAGARVVGGAARRPRRLLVVGETALSLVLLIAAALLFRSYAGLRAAPPGFDPTNVATARVSLDDARYAEVSRVTQLFDQTLERLTAAPGVEAAGVMLGLPYERLLNLGFRFEDGPRAGEAAMMNLSYATPGAFRALRMSPLRGRLLDQGDAAAAPPVVIVTDAFARRYFPDEDPVGRRILFDGRSREIVGVVGDVQQRPSFDDTGPLAPTPLVYMPAAQATGGMLRLIHTWFAPCWVVRSAAGTTGALGAIQNAIGGIDPLLPIAAFRSMSDVQAMALTTQRTAALLLAGLAVMATALAAIGLYGLIAMSIAERTTEFGVRMALGADTRRTLVAAAAPGLALAAAGVAIGCGLALASAQALDRFVWGVSVVDPPAYLAACGALLATATAASLWPARRLLELDPAAILRRS